MRHAITVIVFLLCLNLPNAFGQQRVIRNVTPDNFTKGPEVNGLLEREASAPRAYPLARKVGTPMRDPVVLSSTELRFKGLRFIIKGIEGPEFSDWCESDEGVRSPCGREARKLLYDKVRFALLQCRFDERISKREAIGDCLVDGEWLSTWLVDQGAAKRVEITP